MVISNDSKLSASNSSNFSSSFSSTSSDSKQVSNQSLMNDFTSENYFMKNHKCFNDLIQYELQYYDPSENKELYLNQVIYLNQTLKEKIFILIYKYSLKVKQDYRICFSKRKFQKTKQRLY
jgi:hypothetical protein